MLSGLQCYTLVRASQITGANANELCRARIDYKAENLKPLNNALKHLWSMTKHWANFRFLKVSSFRHFALFYRYVYFAVVGCRWRDISPGPLWDLYFLFAW